MTPAEREAKSLGGQIGAHNRWARCTDRSAELAPARRGFLEKLAKQADPDGVMTTQQRADAVDHLLQAHYARMRLARTQRRNRATTTHAA